MYCSHFGLHRPPFNNTPDPSFYYSTPDHEEALATLQYATLNRKGFVLVTGDIGAGKTLIGRMFIRQIDRQASTAVITHTQLNAAQLLAAICSEFEIDVPPGATNLQLADCLQQFLLEQFAQDRFVVVLLDEAQNLPDESFEALRMLGNLEADDAKLLQVCILGQPELRDRFKQESMRQLDQRLFRRFHLSALTQQQTSEYILRRLRVAGANGPELFTPAALERIYAGSGGIPRLINRICDNCLLTGYAQGRTIIEPELVNQVLEQEGLSGGPDPSLPVTAPSEAETQERIQHIYGEAPQLVESVQPAEVATTVEASQENLASAANGDVQNIVSAAVAQWPAVKEAIEHQRVEIQSSLDAVTARCRQTEEQIEQVARESAPTEALDHLHRLHNAQTTSVLQEIAASREGIRQLVEQTEARLSETQSRLQQIETSTLSREDAELLEQQQNQRLTEVFKKLDQHHGHIEELIGLLQHQCDQAQASVGGLLNTCAQMQTELTSKVEQKISGLESRLNEQRRQAARADDLASLAEVQARTRQELAAQFEARLAEIQQCVQEQVRASSEETQALREAQSASKRQFDEQLERGLADLQGRLDAEFQAVARNDQLEEIRGSNARAHDQLAQHVDAKLNALMDRMQDQLASAAPRTELEALRQQAATAAELEELRQQTEETRQTLQSEVQTQVEQTRTALRERIDEATRSLGDLCRSQARLESGLSDELKAELAQTHERLDGRISETTEELADHIQTNDDAHAEFSRGIEESSRRIQGVESELAGAARRDELAAVLTRLEGRDDTQQAQLDHHEADIDAHQAALSEQRQKLDEQQATAQSTQQTLQTQQSHLDRHESAIDLQKTVIESHRTVLGEHATALGEHGATLGQHGEILGGHGTILSEHGITLGRHDTTLDEHTAALAEHDSTLGEHTTVLGEQAATLSEHDAAIGRHETSLTEQRAAMTQLSRQLTSHETSLQTLTRDAAARFETVGEALDKLQQNSTSTADLDRLQQELRASVGELLAGLDGKSRDLAALRQTLDDRCTQLLDQQDAATGTLNNRVSEQEQHVRQIRKRLVSHYAAVQERFAALQQEFATRSELEQLRQAQEVRSAELITQIHGNHRAVQELMDGMTERFRITFARLDKLGKSAQEDNQQLTELRRTQAEDVSNLLRQLEDQRQAAQQQFDQALANWNASQEEIARLQATAASAVELEELRTRQNRLSEKLLQIMTEQRSNLESLSQELNGRCDDLVTRIEALPANIATTDDLSGLQDQARVQKSFIEQAIRAVAGQVDQTANALRDLESRAASVDDIQQIRASHAANLDEIVQRLDGQNNEYQQEFDTLRQRWSALREELHTLARSSTSVKKFEATERLITRNMENLQLRLNQFAQRRQKDVRILVEAVQRLTERVKTMEDNQRAPVRIELRPRAAEELSDLTNAADAKAAELRQLIEASSTVGNDLRDSSAKVEQAIGDWVSGAQGVREQSEQLRQSAAASGPILQALRKCSEAIDAKLKAPAWHGQLRRSEEVAARIEQVLPQFAHVEETTQQWAAQRADAEQVVQRLEALLAEASRVSARMGRFGAVMAGFADRASDLAQTVDAARKYDDQVRPVGGRRKRNREDVQPVVWPAYRTHASS